MFWVVLWGFRGVEILGDFGFILGVLGVILALFWVFWGDFRIILVFFGIFGLLWAFVAAFWVCVVMRFFGVLALGDFGVVGLVVI